ncbi:MAG TPA: ATP synthase F1 subunit delta [Lentimicrobium sp.]|nr:ATP synthase F1 subunit delta [Lentimicrobium sp.]
MRDHRINLRYATALYDYAAEKNRIEEVYNDVQLIADIIENSRELRLFLKSPVIFTDKKLKVLSDLFKSKVSEVTYTFIEILVRKRREEYLAGIVESFISLYREAKNIKVAEVTSATPLDAAVKERLVNKLEMQTGSKIILNEIVDPSVIGGLIVRVEGVVFDDTIRKKVQELRQEFNVNTYIKGF